MKKEKGGSEEVLEDLMLTDESDDEHVSFLGCYKSEWLLIVVFKVRADWDDIIAELPILFTPKLWIHETL